ncbi:MAG TPA: hypothetical protein VLL54_11555 [Pyrinomonadaceae bacterium]|nr:hypothetical protein [Pyrinomonadaceae bacterium]
MNLTKGIFELALQKVRYSLRGRYSHANEQQILAKYIERLLPPKWSRSVVDIGAGNGVRWSNSYALVLAGWSALGIEADPQKYSLLTNVYSKFPNARASNSLADPRNVRELLRDFGVEKKFGVLSLDIDGNDYWVLDAILRDFRPGLVVTEINENIPPPLRFVVKFDPEFQLRYHFFGYSIAALEDLCEKHGYGILELEYNNAFLAPSELGAGHFQDAATAYRLGYRDRPERKQRFASNLDMEPLQTMSAEDGIGFIENFYSQDAGNFYLASNKEELSGMISVA